jgi:hypothetical protein
MSDEEWEEKVFRKRSFVVFSSSQKKLRENELKMKKFATLLLYSLIIFTILDIIGVY